jgi:tetratricopeptide (TPR) repeat protein
MGNAAYSLGNYELAASVWLDGIKQFPDDLEMLNNAAYTLASKLNRAAEAKTLAKQAVEKSPGSSEILDTLGFINLQLKEGDEAVAILRRALALASTPQNAMPAGVHLSQALVMTNNVKEAKQVVERIQFVFDNQGQAAPIDLRTQLQELRTQVGLEPAKDPTPLQTSTTSGTAEPAKQ